MAMARATSHPGRWGITNFHSFGCHHRYTLDFSPSLLGICLI